MANSAQKIKVLYVITKSNWGGAQRYVYDLATHLPEGLTAIVACGGQGQLVAKLTKAGVPVETIGGLQRDVHAGNEIKAFWNLLQILKRVAPDVVHLNSSKAGALGALAVRFYNLRVSIHNSLHKKAIDSGKLGKGLPCRIIFTAHGWPFKEKRGRIAKKLIEYGSWLTLFLSDITITVSHDDREKTKDFLWVQEKIRIIHNGIAQPIFKDKETARRLLSTQPGTVLSTEGLWIGSIAELHKNKGLDHAIRAVAELSRDSAIQVRFPALSYVIVGGGEEREALANAITEEKAIKTVVLTGEYPNAAEILKAFDLLLIPSLKEGLPYVLLEAGAAGLPVIASDVGGIPEVIADMKTGIVVRPRRPREILKALHFMLEHPDKEKEFGDGLAKTVETKYTLERMVTETVALYTMGKH